MIIALTIQFHDYEPKHGILDLSQFGNTRIERVVRDQIRMSMDFYQAINIDGKDYPVDQWGILNGSLKEERLNRAALVEKVVSLQIYFD